MKSFSIQISDEAEIDFDNSYQYYSEDSLKVADAFFKKINLGLENIRKQPTAYPVVYKSVRKYVVQKFPFVIYYQIEGAVIQVLAIFHTSRSPKIWNARL